MRATRRSPQASGADEEAGDTFPFPMRRATRLLLDVVFAPRQNICSATRALRREEQDKTRCCFLCGRGKKMPRAENLCDVRDVS